MGCHASAGRLQRLVVSLSPRACLGLGKRVQGVGVVSARDEIEQTVGEMVKT